MWIISQFAVLLQLLLKFSQEWRCWKKGKMREMNLNTEKQIMQDGKEVETVDSAEEVIRISISISSSNNLRVKNSVGKMLECQPRCATAAGGLATMRTSVAFVLRNSPHSARPKVTF